MLALLHLDRHVDTYLSPLEYHHRLVVSDKYLYIAANHGSSKQYVCTDIRAAVLVALYQRILLGFVLYGRCMY